MPEEKPHVTVIMGSDKDLGFTEGILKGLDEEEIAYDLFAASGEKHSDLTREIVGGMEQDFPFGLFCAVAGRGNVLGPAMTGMTVQPVYTCPPYGPEPIPGDLAFQTGLGMDIWSSVRRPSNSPLLTVLGAGNAAKQMAKALRLKPDSDVDEMLSVITYSDGFFEKSKQAMSMKLAADFGIGASDMEQYNEGLVNEPSMMFFFFGYPDDRLLNIGSSNDLWVACLDFKEKHELSSAVYAFITDYSRRGDGEDYSSPPMVLDAKNAALAAARIAGLYDSGISERLERYAIVVRDEIEEANRKVTRSYTPD